MSHIDQNYDPDNSYQIEPVALIEAFDPYEAIQRESVETILREQLDRQIEYGN